MTSHLRGHYVDCQSDDGFLWLVFLSGIEFKVSQRPLTLGGAPVS